MRYLLKSSEDWIQREKRVYLKKGNLDTYWVSDPFAEIQMRLSHYKPPFMSHRHTYQLLPYQI